MGIIEIDEEEKEVKEGFYAAIPIFMIGMLLFGLWGYYILSGFLIILFGFSGYYLLLKPLVKYIINVLKT